MVGKRPDAAAVENSVSNSAVDGMRCLGTNGSRTRPAAMLACRQHHAKKHQRCRGAPRRAPHPTAHNNAHTHLDSLLLCGKRFEFAYDRRVARSQLGGCTVVGEVICESRGVRRAAVVVKEMHRDLRVKRADRRVLHREVGICHALELIAARLQHREELRTVHGRCYKHVIISRSHSSHF